MKKIFIIIMVLSQIFQVIPSFAQEPKKVSPEDSPSLLSETKDLVLIYQKLQRITGVQDSGQIKPYLEELNVLLDKVLIFQESFTPEKKKKVAKQLDQIKKESQKILETPPQKMQKRLESLAGLVLKLMDSLIQ